MPIRIMPDGTKIVTGTKSFQQVQTENAEALKQGLAVCGQPVRGKLEAVKVIETDTGVDAPEVSDE